jgi:hypothetical protein
MNGIYHLGKSAAVDQMNFESKRLNINEIITYNPPPANTKIDVPIASTLSAFDVLMWVPVSCV